MAAAATAIAHLPARRRALRSSLELEVFTGFPYGLLVLDGDGTVVCVNDAAARLLEEAGVAAAGLSCCELLGCRRPGTALAGACVSELALGGRSLLPEVRVDIGCPQRPASVWVAAGTVGEQGAHVVLQLRPGMAGDRRRRTAPEWLAGGPRLRIRCLGRTVVETAGGPLGGAWLDQRAGQLLKYLVAERRRAVTVDEIGESVWPGADYAVGANVRYYIHALRRRLEPQRATRDPSAFIVASSGSYRLRPEEVEVDADLFDAQLTVGLGAVQADPLGAAEQLERGLALYEGDFMADLPYAEWAMHERQRLHGLACAGLRSLADIRCEQGAIDGAAGCLERLAALLPYDEDVHRRLMELDLMQGRRSDVVRRYETLRTRIRRTFGHDPDFTPADLARANQ
jgi:DNA-binding SARP family transcriptional activator